MLGDALAREEVTRNTRGLNLLAAGLAIIGVLILAIAQNPQAVAQSLLDIAQSLLKMVGL